jgi:hypothetical protein
MREYGEMVTDQEQGELRDSLNERFHQLMVEPLTGVGYEPATEGQWSELSSKN